MVGNQHAEIGALLCESVSNMAADKTSGSGEKSEHRLCLEYTESSACTRGACECDAGGHGLQPCGYHLTPSYWHE